MPLAVCNIPELIKSLLQETEAPQTITCDPFLTSSHVPILAPVDGSVVVRKKGGDGGNPQCLRAHTYYQCREI